MSTQSNTISIHAPVKGATGGEALLVDLFRISIHAPVKGATYQREQLIYVLRISIHAPVKGATSFWGLNVTIMIFQSTLP